MKFFTRYYHSFLKRKKGRSVLKHWIVVAPIQFLFSLGGLFIFTLLRLLHPIFHIRVGVLNYTRIGHLAADTEIYLRKYYRGDYSKKEWHLFLSGKPANQQLFKMICRRIWVVKNPVLLWMFERVRLFIGDCDTWIDLPEVETFYDVGAIDSQLKFTEEEEKRGQTLLRELGVPPGAPFVCFHVRDKAYLDQKHPHHSRQQWAYQDYRDCAIENYLPAVNYLASLGIYVLRMGSVVEKVIDFEEDKIIDYATKHRSDFGDIYLNAQCKFFLSSDGGLSSIPWIFNVPVAYANGVPPLAAGGWRKEDVFVSKKLWSIEKKRLLTFREVLEVGADTWFESHKYEEAGIKVIENSKEEILAIVKELNSRLDGTWNVTEEDEERQRCYRDIIPPGHRCYKNFSNMSARFLQDNRELLK